MQSSIVNLNNDRNDEKTGVIYEDEIILVLVGKRSMYL
jgi:hypothetical protein